MKEIKEKETADKQQNLIEGVDYYFDKGFMVLTEHFLTKRGFCCGNGCRHCPYPEAQKSNLQ